jgi:hypothetical protein
MTDTPHVVSVKRAFAFYGFTACPLTDRQIAQCLKAGVDTYSVGCDVAAGFTFAESLRAALSR